MPCEAHRHAGAALVRVLLLVSYTADHAGAQSSAHSGSQASMGWRAGSGRKGALLLQRA